MGAVDEVYMYTSALTQSQIRELACVCEDSKGNAVFFYTLCTPKGISDVPSNFLYVRRERFPEEDSTLLKKKEVHSNLLHRVSCQ